MSFTTMASYPMFKDYALEGGCEELGPNFFDEFLTFDKETAEHTQTKESEPSADDSHSGTTSLNSTEDGHTQHSLWRGDLDLDSTETHFYSERSGRAAISDSELLRLEGITLDSPRLPSHSQRSLPSSPTPTFAAISKRRARVAESLTLTNPQKKASISFDKAPMRGPIRKAPSSPRLRSAFQSHSNSSDLWGRKLQQDASKFRYGFHENSRNLTPPLTCKISDVALNTPKVLSMQEVNDAFANNGTMLHRSNGSANYTTPLATPTLRHSRNASGQFPGSSSPQFPITPHNRNVSSSWSQLPGSPPRMVYAGSRVNSNIDPPLWWSHAAIKMAQPSPSSYHTNPHRATKTLATHIQNGLEFSSNELAMAPTGLMIQMPGSMPRQYPMGSPPMQQGYFTSQNGQQQHQQQRRVIRRQYSSAQLRQPQASSPPTRKNRSESSASESPSPRSPSESTFHVKKRRSPKTNKKSTPRTPTLGGGAADFVNYTPSDSRKILTGVAPSGSSRTKARREKEAMEKRRKFSQAAVRAVRAAGGNIESLVEEGLLV